MSDRLNAFALLISIDLITLLSSEKLLLINGESGWGRRGSSVGRGEEGTV